ncbi:MAG: NAD(P)-binding domain-containing protein [Candidatus Eisenbacteria bacterium]|uniref:shikimate dehydrogenase (NADP(+)) n=1 Tax=Eiseniibacteriota bacterium TaxID=2212470 RepID=A0A9D6LCR1_UNCEI|nr:NAD(P)-binding domain-containing protein [Candidatus Eisenbacteria bacterium]MBI3540314.1 NAD(P)-binding domain-containing protein [Candidatus Eisenbacteria bacterium]
MFTRAQPVAAVRLAVLGDPIAHSRSPELHRAALAALGLAGDSRAVRTTVAGLGTTLAALAAEGVHGVNLTHPLKEAALAHVARVSDAARRARSINTIGFAPEGAWGDTTDGAGFVDLLAELGEDSRGARVVLLGAGGAARSLALALGAAGATDVAASARTPDRAGEAWREIPGARLVGWRSRDEAEALAAATIVVNATPIAGDDPAPIAAIAREALIVDLVYGDLITPWVARARADLRRAHDGLGLLVMQARHSLARWLGRPVPLEPLARAVGWPR